MLLKNAENPGIEVAQSYPAIRAGDAQIHISEELLPIRIAPPFLPKLIKNRVDFLFAKHQRFNPPMPFRPHDRQSSTTVGRLKPPGRHLPSPADLS